MGHGHVVTQLAVDQGGEGADAAARAGAGRATQERGRLDGGVRLQLDRSVDQGGGGVDDRHPGAHVPLVDAPLGVHAHCGQVGAVVDAQQDARIVDLQRLDPLVLSAQHRQDAGEVALALGVVGPHLLQGFEQGFGIEGEQARVHLADLQLVCAGVAGVLGLHHALDLAVGPTHHAAIAGRVFELHRGHRGGGRRTGVRVGQAFEHVGGDQRHVTGQHQHRSVVVDLPGRRQHRVAGALRLLLHGHGDALGQVAVERPRRPVHHHHSARAGLAGRAHRPFDHRPPAQVVQHLWRGRAHARPLPRGQDHDRGSAHRGDARRWRLALRVGAAGSHAVLDGWARRPPRQDSLCAARKRRQATRPPRAPTTPRLHDLPGYGRADATNEVIVTLAGTRWGVV